MFVGFLDGLQSSIAIGLETCLYGFAIAMEQYGDSGGVFSFVMKGESVHAYHDVWLRMVKPVATNDRKVSRRNRNAEHNIDG